MSPGGPIWGGANLANITTLTVQSELSHRGPQVDVLGKRVRPVDGLRVRSDRAFGKLPHLPPKFFHAGAPFGVAFALCAEMSQARRPGDGILVPEAT